MHIHTYNQNRKTDINRISSCQFRIHIYGNEVIQHNRILLHYCHSYSIFSCVRTKRDFRNICWRSTVISAHSLIHLDIWQMNVDGKLIPKPTPFWRTVVQVPHAHTTNVITNGGHNSPSISLPIQGILGLNDSFTFLINTLSCASSIHGCWRSESIIASSKPDTQTILIRRFCSIVTMSNWHRLLYSSVFNQSINPADDSFQFDYKSNKSTSYPVSFNWLPLRNLAHCVFMVCLFKLPPSHGNSNFQNILKSNCLRAVISIRVGLHYQQNGLHTLGWETLKSCFRVLLFPQFIINFTR